jgi:hypothetical protein
MLVSENVGREVFQLEVTSTLLVVKTPGCGCISRQMHDEEAVRMIRDLTLQNENGSW